MHVLLVGKDMGRYEKNWLSVMNQFLEEACILKNQNVGPGGERVRADRSRFLYVCLKFTAPPGGGFQEHNWLSDDA